MPRLANQVTGAVMTVSDSTAARLGSEWGPVEQRKPEPEKEATKRSRKSSSDD